MQSCNLSVEINLLLLSEELRRLQLLGQLSVVLQPSARQCNRTDPHLCELLHLLRQRVVVIFVVLRASINTSTCVCGADTEWYAVRTIVPLRRAASRSCPSISDCGCQSSNDDAVHIRTFAACMFSISLRSALMAVMPFSFS